MPNRAPSALPIKKSRADRTIVVRGFSGAGFSLWGLVLANTKTHRPKPAPLNEMQPFHRYALGRIHENV